MSAKAYRVSVAVSMTLAFVICAIMILAAFAN
jgi:hypothetical protein